MRLLQIILDWICEDLPDIFMRWIEKGKYESKSIF